MRIRHVSAATFLLLYAIYAGVRHVRRARLNNRGWRRWVVTPHPRLDLFIDESGMLPTVSERYYSSFLVPVYRAGSCDLLGPKLRCDFWRNRRANYIWDTLAERDEPRCLEVSSGDKASRGDE